MMHWSRRPLRRPGRYSAPAGRDSPGSRPGPRRPSLSFGSHARATSADPSSVILRIPTMPERPHLIEDENLSRAWVRAIAALIEPGVDALTPLVLTVTLPAEGDLP